MADQKTFLQIVSGQVAAIQARAAGLIDFSVGSILRATVEATAQVVLWLQGLILTFLALARAATSSGADLDSWMADFGLTRLPADKAIGGLTFARLTATSQAFISVGATAQTSDGSQDYVVIADSDNPAYDPLNNGYLMDVGVLSLTVAGQAVVAGSAGNAAPGAISVITSAIPGVDSVTNEDAFAAGSDAESDTAFRLRFILYLAGLDKGTEDAIIEAAQSVAEGVTAITRENELYDGTSYRGYFYVIVDDGTGDPDADFLELVRSAVDKVRGFTITFGVFGPDKQTINVTINIEVVAGYDGPTVKGLVEAAIRSYIDGLGLGVGFAYTRLYEVAYDASEGVKKATGLLINGGTADVTMTFRQTAKAGAVTATVV